MSSDLNANMASQPAARASIPHSQDTSLLSQRIPQELREEIYSYTFSEARLASDRSEPLSDHRRVYETEPNTLALLKTCRRAKIEIGDRWVSQVQFWYDSTTMLAKLSAVPREIVPKIRHVRLCLKSANPTCFLLTKSKDLRLDTFTLVSDYFNLGGVHYRMLDLLVRKGCGWKELHFLCSSGSLGFSYDPFLDAWSSPRSPQPADWQAALEDRDGVSSHPSVTIFRATAGFLHRASNPDTREPFSQAVREDEQSRESFSATEDATLMADYVEEREILVVVKRGHGVDYTNNRG